MTPGLTDPLRDWSLITGRGLQNGRGGGGHVKFYPYKKGGGAEKVLAMLNGGGGTKSFHSFKGGGARKVLPCVEGGRKKFRTRDFPIL